MISGTEIRLAMTDTARPTAGAKTDALKLRYGPSAMPAAGPWNATLDVLLGHRSVRGYTSEPVPAGTLETLIAAAQSAATSSNLQTWSVLSVNDAAKRKVLMEVANNQKHITESPIFLCWLADLSRNGRMAEQEGFTLEGLPYIETFLVAAIDAALAAQNAVVAAESLGLHTVYIGALRNDPERVAKLLELPPGVVCVFGLCVGHARAETRSEVKPRLPQSAILFHERYDTSGEAEKRRAYDAEMTAFSKRHEMSQYTWTERVKSRLGPLKGMSGRHKLKAALRSLGFPLS